eukprot:CAMPEP_0206146908 /NCGR_PEP_ID=MMETSP1473-20131121/31781_1 /ASSEMBLY_ACC=CAM_ASM_001109 /TAXON_ID=1461547 /ORGANISM="Stichococcus sp, Strain RCC1054" /LENGTH=45 /DNA_ID= /DNA_START= /DNA_END= /DNA_ORIENTATION=
MAPGTTPNTHQGQQQASSKACADSTSIEVLSVLVCCSRSWTTRRN